MRCRGVLRLFLTGGLALALLQGSLLLLQGPLLLLQGPWQGLLQGSSCDRGSSCSPTPPSPGPGLKVVAFTLYGSMANVTTPPGTANMSMWGPSRTDRQYLAGVEENLALLHLLPGEGWLVRLYHDLEAQDPLLAHLCSLSSSHPSLSLVSVSSLWPGVSLLFPMLWRFLPTLEPEVAVLLSRDLDSRINAREAAAVAEWLEGGRAVHSLRDHPAHTEPLQGGLWGANLTCPGSRELWSQAWGNIVMDPRAWVDRTSKFEDQGLLKDHVWPWASKNSFQHDSYNCKKHPGSRGFPTQREAGPSHFVGSIFTEGPTLMPECPELCRREKTWKYC